MSESKEWIKQQKNDRNLALSTKKMVTTEFVPKLYLKVPTQMDCEMTASLMTKQKGIEYHTKLVRMSPMIGSIVINAIQPQSVFLIYRNIAYLSPIVLHCCQSMIMLLQTPTGTRKNYHEHSRVVWLSRKSTPSLHLLSLTVFSSTPLRKGQCLSG